MMLECNLELSVDWFCLQELAGAHVFQRTTQESTELVKAYRIPIQHYHLRCL